VRAIDGPDAQLILAFLDRIGIAVTLEPIAEDTFLPALRPRGGALIVDPERLEWPGDLLHEAGHIAVTDPALRPQLDDVTGDPGEEMAAIAWSYAAAVEIGLDPAVLFHPHGYRGGAQAMIDNFTVGRGVGIPMLAWFGMSAEPHRAAADGMRPYPHMVRWLR
jgi:hypothetical protein